MKKIIFLLTIVLFTTIHATSSFDIYQTWVDLNPKGFTTPNRLSHWSIITINPDNTVTAFIAEHYEGGGTWYEGIVTSVENDTLTIEIKKRYGSCWYPMIDRHYTYSIEEVWQFKYDHEEKLLRIINVVNNRYKSRISVSQTFQKAENDSQKSLIVETGSFINKSRYVDIPINLIGSHFTI